MSEVNLKQNFNLFTFFSSLILNSIKHTCHFYSVVRTVFGSHLYCFLIYTLEFYKL